MTILLAPGFDDLPEFLAASQVEIVASLPCYLEENTDAQRGDGAFAQSIDAFNPATVSGLMCRNTLSVGWDGRLFDCDFNQMLNLEVGEGCSSNIHQFNAASLAGRASAVTPTTSST
ncbi:MAG: DUF3641 domain-containing protein [Planctomycetes bacterium]|nr:DUF3641 domain-containing protein [Planctomycetota bacterium]